MNRIITVIATLAWLTTSINFFTLSRLSTKNGAVCLDGSPAAIYTYEPDNVVKAPNKILIMFESAPNGWCFK